MFENQKIYIRWNNSGFFQPGVARSRMSQGVEGFWVESEWDS